jgi:hypothetical protein
VGEDGESAAVEDEPLRDFAELGGGNRQLAAAARVRPDGPKMVMAFGNPEPLARGMSQRLRLLDLSGIEIDVGVKVADHAL